MESKRCLACRCSFHPRTQNPHQTFCTKKPCQRERRRRWQKEKRQKDADYRENQAHAQQAWLKRHPDYWQKYRANHPEQREKNRSRQRQRRLSNSVAKMDVSEPISSLVSGIYRMIRLPSDTTAKMDVWTVQVSLLSSG